MCRRATEYGSHRFDPQWLGSGTLRVVHPDAPAGSGGPGIFRSAGTVFGEGGRELLPHPQAPAARALDPGLLAQAQELQASKATRQPAPKVLQPSSQMIRGMTVKILPDQNHVAGLRGAYTDFQNKPSGSVSQTANAAGKVATVSNTLKWTIEIVTQYDSAGADTDSAYGRGTTTADIAAGNVSLGFHESCHRNDLVAYFTATATPTFEGAVGQTVAEFKTAADRYAAAWERYFADARADTLARTDEVGKPTKSEYEAVSP